MKKPNKEAQILVKYISEYLRDYVPNHKTQSYHTRKAYETALKLYLTFLEQEKKIKPETFTSDSFSRSNIEEWLVWLQEKRNNSAQTCNNRLASLREFLKYLRSRSLEYSDIYMEAKQIPKRKTQKTKIKGLSKNAVQELLRTPYQTTKIGRRDVALMVLLYSTAIRLDELLSLKIKDLQLEGKNSFVKILGKGNKLRTIPIMNSTVKHLKAYISEFHGDKPDQQAYLFYSRNTGLYGKMSQTAVDKMLKKHAAAANRINPDVPLNLHAHQFRHARASHLLEDGMNIVQISLLLGHEQLETTMIYLDVTQDAHVKLLELTDKESHVERKWKKDAGILELCGLN